jgi:hypothetical protein
VAEGVRGPVVAPEEGLSGDPQVRNERRLRLLYGERIDELHALTKEQVIEKHDAHVEEARNSNKQGVRLLWLERAQVYRDELARRETVRLTKSLNRLTWVITVATIIVMALTAWTVIYGA